METAETPRGPAYRVRTPRLLLRCWNPEDAARLRAAIVASLEHLRAWMPWAMEEPETVEAKARRLRGFRASFDTDREFLYGIFARGGRRVLGGIGLHPRIGEGGLEIGYWIRPDFQGRGLVSEATAALVRVAFEVHAARRVEIRCDPGNTRSFAVPARLGFTHEATLRQNALSPDGGPRDTMVWALLAADYRAGPVVAAPAEAFDATGRRLL
jgi:RimJ/RimL family protein N-acetyltransferase